MAEMLQKFCRISLIIIGLAAVGCVSAPEGGETSGQGDFQKGLDAYTNKDYITALKEWKPLAEQGNPDAQTFLGRIYDRGLGVLEDDREAVKWYTLAAEQGFAPAQLNLGFMYLDGDGVPQDDGEAVKWFTLAAEQGYAEAQSDLGWRYYHGEGVLQDDVFALMWWNIASSRGYEDASEKMREVEARMTPSQLEKVEKLSKQCLNSNYQNCEYEATVVSGDLPNVFEAYINRNDEKSLEEWKPLAEQGDAEAQYNLGLMYKKGEGVPEDKAEAVKWFTLAAEQGNESAQAILGYMYELGEGVLQDYVSAFMWWNIASSLGNENAKSNRERIAKKMTSSQIEKAQELSKQCLNSNYENCD